MHFGKRENIFSSRRTADICLLELARPDGGTLPAFSAGAHIDVHLADGIIRQYSLCNQPGETRWRSVSRATCSRLSKRRTITC